MAEWRIADVPVFDAHLQVWMLLVAGVLLCWLGYVWPTRSMN